MSVIFESAGYQADPRKAATHVLLIGCGEYPGLAASGHPLQPLKPPRHSVIAMADWFLSGTDAMPPEHALSPEKAFHNPSAPLGTLAMLVSPMDDYTTPSGIVATCTRPTRDNIQRAYHEWVGRLETNPESRGIFYFCGHGLSDGINQSLVADDIFETAHNRWGGLFHVSNTCQATIRATKATLAFWVDACAEFSEDVLNTINPTQGLLDGPRSGIPLTRDWSVLRATTTNRRAFAPEDGVARFTDALLRALKGHCGTQRTLASEFSIAASELRTATADFLAYSQRNINGERQELGSADGDGAGETPLHVLTSRPVVLVEMDVEPRGCRAIACAFMEDAANGREQKPLAAGPAGFLKEQGEWSLGASPLDGQFEERVFARQLLKNAAVVRSIPIEFPE